MNMKSKYVFTRNNKFADIDDLSLLLIHWSFGGYLIYIILYRHPPHDSIMTIAGFICAALLFFHPNVFKATLDRWKLYKYNKDVCFVIDTLNGMFSYKNKLLEIHFHSNDIEKWWVYDYGFLTTFSISIIEFQLKNGKKVIVSSELIDADDMESSKPMDTVQFIGEHWLDLGLPKGAIVSKSEKYKHFCAFMEEIAE